MMIRFDLGVARRILAAAALTSLLGCSAIGEGSLPVSAILQPLGGLEGAASANAYTCLNTGVSMIITFSNSQRGDFTSRATWSSSDSTVAKVSNGTEPVPGSAGSVYVKGVIIPVSGGPTGTATATITGTYLSFTKSIDIVVGTPANLHITPATANLAPTTLLNLLVLADLNGVTTSVNSSAVWAFATPNDAVATLSATTGIITGVTDSGASPLTAQVSFPGCALTAKATVNVSKIATIALTKEFPGNNLVVGTTEAVTATGTLANGQTQILTGQFYTAFKSTVTDPATTAVTNSASLLFLTGTLRNLMIGISASAAVDVSAVYDASASYTTTPPVVTQAVVTSNKLSITPYAATLNKISVTPTTADVPVGKTVQLYATGEYIDNNTQAVTTQDITRHVNWTSGDTTQVLIATSDTSGLSPSAGLAGPLSTATVCNAATVCTPVIITATNMAATAQPTATSALTVRAATNP